MSIQDAPVFERRELVKQLLINRGSLLVVSGLGSATYDVAAAGDHPLNLYQWGGMGGTLMIGLGLALARPDRRVLVVTGDGDALMGLGSLATIGVKQPANLAIVVLDNGRYGETGMQASHTAFGVDLVGVAQSCRFATAQLLEDPTAARQTIHEAAGPIFLRARIANDEVERVLPTRDGNALRVRFAEALGT